MLQESFLGPEQPCCRVKLHSYRVRVLLESFLPNFIGLCALNIVTLLTEVRKSMAINKQSIAPSQLSLDIQKKIDTESRELELGLLYDAYLQSMAINLIMKKKAEEKKHLMVTQLATVAQEIDRDTEKLIKIKTREREIINLSLAQKMADAQLIAVTKCISKIQAN